MLATVSPTPAFPLYFPTRRRDWPQLPLRYWGPAPVVRLQEQNLLLDVRRQEKQVHDLGQPGARDVAEPRQFRLIGNLAVADQLVGRIKGDEDQGGRG